MKHKIFRINRNKIAAVIPVNPAVSVVSHRYTVAGSYTATMNVLSGGQSAQATVGITVGNPPVPLSVAMTALPLSGDAPLTVSFTATASGGVPPYAYGWAFGDGGTSTLQNPSHIYQSPGTFGAIVTATAGVETAQAQVSIAVSQPQVPLSANATANPTSGIKPLAVDFTGSASGGVGGYTYRWTFGDGGTSTTQNPSHIYVNAGNYSSALTVTSGSQTASDTVNISVTEDNPSNNQNLFENPFTYLSAHHRPIGSGAQYAGANHATTVSWNNSNFSTINFNNGYSAQFYKNSTSDSFKIVNKNEANPFGDWPFPSTRMPPMNVLSGDTNEGVISLFDAAGDGDTIHEFYRFRWNGGSPLANGYRRYSARGRGHPNGPGTARVGNSASGFGLSGGMVKGVDLTGTDPIMHALCIILGSGGTHGNQQVSREIVWPACAIDGLCSDQSLCNGTIPYGSLFALPPSVDITTLGLSAMGKRLAAQARDYGWYVNDTGASNLFRGDKDLTQTLVTEAIAQFKIIKPLMRRVLNNESTATQPTCSGGGTPLAPNGAFDAPLSLGAAEVRDARYWPFTSESPWNRPIGSGAEANLVDHPILRTTSAYINSTAWTVSVSIHNPANPLVDITQFTECGQGAASSTPPPSIYMPVGVTGSPPFTCYRDGILAAIHSDGKAYGFIRFRRTGDNSGTYSYHRNADYDHIVNGSGWKPDQGWDGGGHWTAGSNFLGGLMRIGDLDKIQTGTIQYIRYALQCSLPYSMLKQKVGGDQTTTFRWPAQWSDGDGSAYYGTIHLGSLLTIPSSFNIEGQAWTDAAKALARTLQKYGAYVVAAGGDGLIFYAEIGANSTAISGMLNNINAIRDQLRVVNNNGPTAIGGGGSYPSSLWPIPTPVF